MTRSAGRARPPGRRAPSLVLALLATLAATSVAACTTKKTDGGVSSVPDAAPPPVAISAQASPPDAAVAPGRPRTTSWSIAGSNLDGQIADPLRRSQPGVEEQSFLAQLYLERGNFLANVDDYEKAEAIGAKLDKSQPTKALAHLTHAAALGALHKFEAQAKALDEAVALKAPPESVIGARVSLLMARGNYDEAGKVLAPLGDSRSPTPIMTSAVLAGRMQKHDESERLFERARAAFIDVSPFPVAWMYFQHGSLLEARGMEKEARAYYLEALEAIPVYVHAAVHVATTDPPERAVERLEALRSVTTDPELLAALADAHRRAKHEPEAKKATEAARARYEELLTKHPEAYADHAARFYLGSGSDPKKALEHAEKNARLRPTEEAIDLWMAAAAAAQRKDQICASAIAMKQVAYASETRKRLAAAASRDCPDAGPSGAGADAGAGAKDAGAR